MTISTSWRRCGLASILATAVLLVAATASAQTYGTANLYPGFGSQALSGMSGGVAGTPGGEINATSYGSSPTGPCRGYIAPTPDHVMNLSAPFTSLAIQVTTNDGGDSTMVISGPGGTYCNDDAVGLNPGITNAFPAGTYSIWVGSYAQGINHPYTITFTEMGAAPPPPLPTPMATLNTGSMTPNDPMGPMTLAPGFLPDPQTRTGTVTGVVDLNSTPNLYGGTCRGYAQVNPSHVMTLTAAFTYLRLHVRSDRDLTMAVMDPSGGFWCNDDSDGLNPVIEGPWSPGSWRIWIGSYSSGSTANYSIEFTEYAQAVTTPTPVVPTPTPVVVPTPVVPTPAIGLITASVTPTDPAGQIMLATGFMPDPQTRSGMVTGAIAATALPNAYGGTCRGFVQSNPDHIMNLTSPFDYLRVHVQSTNDTTLVVQGPDGQYWCNDDADGLNPVIEGPWSPGMWRVWVGTYSQGASAGYTINFSEFQRTP